VLEKVVVNIFDARERCVWNLNRRQDVGVLTVETVEMIDEAEAPDPLIHSEQIEACRTDEDHWAIVANEVVANVREAVKSSLGHEGLRKGE
jgi:hypothetical protein